MEFPREVEQPIPPIPHVPLQGPSSGLSTSLGHVVFWLLGVFGSQVAGDVRTFVCFVLFGGEELYGAFNTHHDDEIVPRVTLAKVNMSQSPFVFLTVCFCSG